MGRMVFAKATPPTPPVIVVGSPANNSLTINITTASTEPVNGVSGYDIERSLNNFSTWTVVASNVAYSSFPYVDATLSQSTLYYYRLRGVDNGVPPFRSKESNVASGTTTGTASLVITTSSPLPSATVGSAYSYTMAATGGVTPYTWSITADTPDTGSWLSINSGTGALSGTPTTAETESLTIKVTDSASDTASDPFTLVVNASGGVSLLAYINTLGINGAGVMTGQTLGIYNGDLGPAPLWDINTTNSTEGWAANPTVGEGSSQTPSGYLPCVIDIFCAIITNSQTATTNIGGGGGSWDNTSDTTNGWLAMAEGAQAKNLIVKLDWIPNNPAGGGNNPWPNVITPGTATYNTYVGWLNQLAIYLKNLTKPFIFCPTGELNDTDGSGYNAGDGNWQTSAQCTNAQAQALWSLQYEILVTNNGIKNMLWCFETNFGQGNNSFGYVASQTDLIAGDVAGGVLPLYTNSSDYTWCVSQGKPFFLGSVWANSSASAYSENIYTDSCTYLGYGVSNPDGINGYPASFCLVEWCQGASYGQALQSSVVPAMSGSTKAGSANFLNNTNLPTFTSAGGVAGG